MKIVFAYFKTTGKDMMIIHGGHFMAGNCILLL